MHNIEMSIKMHDVIDTDICSNEEDELQPMHLCIHVNNDGSLSKHTQIDNYIYRDHNLNHVSFYEFVQCFRIEKQGKQRPNQASKRLETYVRYELLFPHPLHGTHQIVQHTDDQHYITRQSLVPAVIGMSVPCLTSPIYKLFILSHFKLFHNDIPLFASTETIEDLYSSYPFSPYALQVMKNWEAINECEDERDAEQLKKREALTRESQALTKFITANFDNELAELNLHDLNSAKKDFQVNCELLKLIQSKWLDKTTVYKNSASAIIVDSGLPTITPQQIKKWKMRLLNKKVFLKEYVIIH
jgi:hypothetical protein